MKMTHKSRWITWMGVVCALLALPVQAASVDQYVDQAKQFQQKGDYRAAIIQLKNALQQDARRPQLRLMLGESYLKIGDGASAENELKQARDLGADAAQVLPLLGQTYLQEQKFREVIKLTPPQGSAPTLKAVLLALQGTAYLGLGDTAKAKENIQSALLLDPVSEQALLAEARLTLVQKDTDKAAKQIDDLVQRFPDSVEAWLLKGQLHRLRNEYPAGAEAYAKALALEPENLGALLGEAMMLIAQKKFDGARPDLDKILKLSPTHPVAHYLEGLSAFQQGKLPAAEEELQKALAVAPNYAAAHLLLGAIQYNKGELEQAAESLKQFVAAFPDQLPARKLYAATLLKLKQPDRALEVLNVAAQHDSKDAQILSLMGSAYMQKRDYTKGTEYLEKAVAAAPNAAGLHTQLALGYIAAGESGQAVSQLEDAADLGGAAQADFLLVLTHLERHEYDQALKTAKDLGKKLPTNPLPYNLMGAAYLGKKDPSAARKEFDRAIKVDPSFAPAHINLAKLDEMAGDTASAKRHFQAILDKNDKNVAAMVGMARLAERAGDQQETLRWLQQARNQDPDALEPALQLVHYDLSYSDPLKALSVAQDLISRHPDNPLALEAAGEVQMANKQTSNAIASFRKLISLQPKAPRAYFLFASAEAQDKDYPSAQDGVNKALQLQPDFPEALVLLAVIQNQQGQLQEAVDTARRLQKLHPKMALGYEVEGDFYAGAGRAEEADKAYEVAYQRGSSVGLVRKLYRVRNSLGRPDAVQPLVEWIKKNPDDMATTMILAGAYQADDKNEDAIAQYEKVVKKQPENAIALNNLAWLYQLEGDRRAVATAERAYKLKPEEPSIVDTLGWLLVQNGDNGRAVTLLQEAAMRAPHMPEIRYHMAVGLAKAGRKEEARKELERLLQENKDTGNFAQADDAQKLLEQLQK